jgi:hypothetical protein
LVTAIQLAGSLQPMLVDGTVGLVWAPGGRLSWILKFAIASGKIVDADIVVDPARLRELHLVTIDR